MTAIAEPRQSINSSVYDISPGATSVDVRELLEVKLMHLDAMLVMTWGVGGEAFRKQSVAVQDGFMWSCHDAIVEECRELANLTGLLVGDGR
ncbi:hypothetical protein [Accumulibacter sp.]|jgi:hypothetical protein|uniref:Uncharacterized protein n=1 Tax=Accumulibacter regalis TaxID=522306 RepID=C7RV97_ACCRE|nr:hypothetical protein [Accumulibacter sp.]MBN8498083.1 hypothetical protein [Accumulibacter sp.]MBO3715111.1 hypothetical protein [Accumulibacter sp.]